MPEKHTQNECLEYLQSDRYAGMMLVWRSYNHLSLDNAEYYQRLATLEQDGACCGYGPPMRCTVREGRPLATTGRGVVLANGVTMQVILVDKTAHTVFHKY